VSNTRFTLLHTKMVASEPAQKTPLRSIINIKQQHDSDKSKERHGIKRSPTSPLTPIMDRYNVRKRKLVDTGTRKDTDSFSSPRKGKHMRTKSEESVPRNEQLHTQVPSFDALRYYLFEEHKRNWILNKRNKDLRDMVHFLELEKRFKVEIKHSHI